MLRIGSPDQFSTLRHSLELAEYDERQLCDRFGLESLEKFEEEFDRSQIESFEKDAAGILLQLFIEGHYIDVALAERRLGSAALQAMADLGLIERHPSNHHEIASTVALYPTAGVWIASDRWNRPDRSAYKPAEDVVYPAIVSNAQRFLRFMPPMKCESLLDVCSGTAFAALHGAKNYAQHAWALDIASRSTLFAEFNRRLNGIENVTTGTGDLYRPAEGRQFDRIVAHPPYVPVLRPKWVYHDGGEDGEHIVRRCVEGVPDHLRPGGLFYLMAMVSDRTNAPLERRVRAWLGERGEEFDVAVFAVRSLDPEEFAVRAVVNSENPPNDMREFKKRFREWGVQEMIYSILMIQRRAEPRSVFTIRRQNTNRTTTHDVSAVMRWETLLMKPEATATIMRSRIRANRDADMRVRHTLIDGGWEIAEYMLRTSFPFSMEAKTDPWGPYLMAQCDGTRTVGEHFDELKAQEAVPADAPAEEFGRAVAVLVSGGFLLLEH